MASDVDIANLALTDLGSQRITALTDATEHARKVNSVFAQTRQELLAEHPWNFAIKRANLGLLGSTPEFGWSYQFSLPTDYLRIANSPEVDPETDYVIEGGMLLADVNAIKLRYVFDQTDTTKYSPKFVAAFAALLAARLAIPITNKQSIQEAMLKVYAVKLEDAKAIDAQESIPDEIDESPWITDRA